MSDIPSKNDMLRLIGQIQRAKICTSWRELRTGKHSPLHLESYESAAEYLSGLFGENDSDPESYLLLAESFAGLFEIVILPHEFYRVERGGVQWPFTKL